MTIREIAQNCGVSPATVSRVVSGHALVNPQTREKIEHYIAECGYTPRKASRASQRSGIIGVLLPDFQHCFFRFVMEEVDRQLKGTGQMSMILPYSSSDEQARLRYLKQVSVDGMILLQEESAPALFELLASRRIPAVMCGALALDNKVSSVHADDLVAAYDGTRYLLNLGHREIGFVTDHPYAVSSGFQRVAGSRKALEDYGVRPREDMVVNEGGDYASGCRGAQRLLAANPNLTAIFAFSDAAAVGVIDTLNSRGLRVPEDVSVLGFDDVDVGIGAPPFLTTVHQPVVGFVTKSLEILEELRRDRTRPESTVILPHRIVERKTCQARNKEEA